MKAQTQREDSHVRAEAEAGNAWGDRKLEEARKDPSLEGWERAGPCQQLDFRVLASRAEMTNFCDFKPPYLWCFVTTAMGNEYKGPIHDFSQKLGLCPVTNGV